MKIPPAVRGVSEETVSGTRRDVGEDERTHRLKDVLVYGPTGSL